VIHTSEVREIKIVRMPDGKEQAFYRFVNSRSLYWHSMNLGVAKRAIAKGKGEWSGTSGPAKYNQEASTHE
jgi:hypothetical protein